MSEPLDCIACGACCFASGESLIAVSLTDSDLQRLHPDEFGAVVPFRDFLCFEAKPAQDGKGPCVFLDGTRGDCRCSIYERRPDACRTYEVGAKACLSARRRAGIDEARESGGTP